MMDSNWIAGDNLLENLLDSAVNHYKDPQNTISQDDNDPNVGSDGDILPQLWEYLNVREDALDNATQRFQPYQEIVTPGRKNNKVWTEDMSNFPPVKSSMDLPLDPKSIAQGNVRPSSPIPYHLSEHSTAHFKGNIPKALPQQNQFVMGGGMPTSTVADQPASLQDFQGGADGSNNFAYLSDGDTPLREKPNQKLVSLVSQPSGGKKSPVSADVSLKGSRMGGLSVVKSSENANELGDPMSQVSAVDLPSDLEKISLYELLLPTMNETDPFPVLPSMPPAGLATPGDQINAVQTCTDNAACPNESVLESTPLPRQSLSNGLDSRQQQERNTSLSSAARPPGIDAQPRRSLQQWSSPRLPQKRKAAETQLVQGTPSKILRTNPGKQFPSGGVVTSIPQGFSGRSTFPQRTAAPLDTIAFQQRGSEGTGVPAIQEGVKTFACKMATKDKLKQTVCKRVDQLPEIDWNPRPSYELTPAEKARKDKQREKNKISAQRTRQKEKETIESLEREVQRLEEERRQLSDEMADVTKEMSANQALLDSHQCVLRK